MAAKTAEEKAAAVARMQAGREAKRATQAALKNAAEDAKQASESAAQENAAEASTETAQRSFTEAEVQEIVARALAAEAERRDAEARQREANLQEAGSAQTANTGTAEKVHFLWQAPVSEDNEYQIPGGTYGCMTGASGFFTVPKAELPRAMDGLFRTLLKQRWVIVLSGLTQEERQALDVDYKPGEILDQGAFRRLTELGDEILEIYPALCEGHREIVQKRWYEAYRNGSGSGITRERVSALREIAARLGERDTAFNHILEEMNAAEAAG